MRLVILPVILLVFAVRPASAAEEGDRTAQVDRAVGRGLDALQIMQDKKEGCWRDRHNRPNPAVTGLAVMAFLSAGHVPGEGRYGAVVEKGIRWILRKQKPNGLLATDGHQEMYQHGIATLMLAEAAGMASAELGQDIRNALAKAVRIILKAQRTNGHDRGGWRYRVAHVEGTDISVTGWQVMALRAARNLGCDVPAEAIDRAVAYIKRCQDNGNGGFRYRPGEGVTVACTGTSILALEICGKEHHHCEEAKRGGAFLLLRQNLPHKGQQWFFYSIYYGSQAAFQLGGNYWKLFRPRLHEVLLSMQKGGFWDGNTGDAQQGGRAYCTAMAILALTVEYRFLPIYQRGEEPTEK
ncbi:MAG TPA: prenyltransferase/squalene oxidase repeat-containing protein [Gemmataceae bacterium]|nr:prenyltransferase/squalene oxidase repeat-containing protein [Gemmataceae bacterium]